MEHPLLTEDGAWISAGDVQVKDQLMTRQGRKQVRSITSVSAKTTVYNLTVDKSHTFLVGNVGLISHNAGGRKKGCELGASSKPPIRIQDLELSSDGFSIQARVPGDPKAFFRAEIPSKPGVIEVTDLFRGDLPKGSGGAFMANALLAHRAIPSNQLILKGITNEPTLALFKAGGKAGNSLLANTARNALKELGLRPTGFRFELVRNKLNLIIDVAK